VRTWLALALQGRRDHDADPRVLRQRDRAIATAVPTRASTSKRVKAWIEAVLDSEDRVLLHRVDQALRGLSFVLTVLGLIAGTGVAAAVFRYDGSRPIDLLPTLAVFVVMPLLLWLGFLVSALPAGALRAIPLLRELQENLLALASALASALLRALPAETRHTLTRTFGEGRAHQRVFGRVQKWMLLGELQRFAVAFHVGAIAWFIGRVFVTDLGFTWSATAEAVTPERLHVLFDAMATPWSAFWSNAVPTLEDVRATQFFRLGDGTVGDATTSGADPARLGRWWTFVLASMITYGLLPRVLAATLASARTRAAVAWTIANAPVARDALDRMDAPAVAQQAPVPEVASAPDAPAVEAAPGPTGGAAHVIVWSDALDESGAEKGVLADSLDVTSISAVDRAGGATTLAEDEALVAKVAASLPDDGAAVLVVKAWEPATMDAIDFVRALRDALGEGRRIVVAARRLNGDDADVAQWRDRMTAVGDPWLRTTGFDPEQESNS